jgi:hypothetical protein
MPLVQSVAAEMPPRLFQVKKGRDFMKTRIVLFATALLMLSASAFAADEYSFKVHNNSGQAIKKILASEDGETYGNFNIGAGIKAGATVTLVWDASTNGESCSQFFKAVFADGEESEATEFDFCEEGLVLEFE